MPGKVTGLVGLILFTAGLFPWLVVAAVPPPDPEKRQTLVRVDSLLAAGNLVQGRDLARSMVAATDGDPQFHWQFKARLGLALLRLDEPLAAVSHLEYAVRAAPQNANNHRNLAAALVALGRRGRALSEYETAVALAPDNGLLRRDFGLVLMEFRNFTDAQIQLETANHLCGGCPEMRAPLAQLYLGLGQAERAVPLLQDLYNETPSVAMRRTLVQALQGAGRPAELTALLGASPTSTLAGDEYFALLAAEFELGRVQRAVELVRVMSRSGVAALDIPESLKSRADFWGFLSYNLLVTENLLPALHASDRAVELDPGNAVYRNNRIVLLEKLGRHEAAQREMDILKTLQDK